MVEVLADPGDHRIACDRRSVPVEDEQPVRCVVDDAMAARLRLVADVELIGAENPFIQALEDGGVEDDRLVLLIVHDDVGPPLCLCESEEIEKAPRHDRAVEDVSVDAGTADMLVPAAAASDAIVLEWNEIAVELVGAAPPFPSTRAMATVQVAVF